MEKNDVMTTQKIHRKTIEFIDNTLIECTDLEERYGDRLTSYPLDLKIMFVIDIARHLSQSINPKDLQKMNEKRILHC